MNQCILATWIYLCGYNRWVNIHVNYVQAVPYRNYNCNRSTISKTSSDHTLVSETTSCLLVSDEHTKHDIPPKLTYLLDSDTYKMSLTLFNQQTTFQFLCVCLYTSMKKNITTAVRLGIQVLKDVPLI